MSASRKFALATLGVAIAILLVGWQTDLRQVMHTGLLIVGTFAFLPFVVIGAGMSLILVVGLVAAFVGAEIDEGGGGEILVEGGLRWIAPYYRWLARQRHPSIWGVPAGVVCCCGRGWRLR